MGSRVWLLTSMFLGTPSAKSANALSVQENILRECNYSDKKIDCKFLFFDQKTLEMYTFCDKNHIVCACGVGTIRDKGFVGPIDIRLDGHEELNIYQNNTWSAKKIIMMKLISNHHY